MGQDDPFEREPSETVTDPYRSHSWVNICINILIRNIGRAHFLITKNGEEVTSDRIFSLFRDVNPGMNRCDLWKETAAWWFLEGEAFWFFGDDYSAGIPYEIYVLNPRKMRAYVSFGKIVRWFYSTDQGEIPLLPDELIHFRAWNPWNPHRGVSPLIALTDEINQDVRSNKSISKLLKNNSVPEGILKTDQVLREEEADKLERRWETSYGRNKKARSIAVLGKGTSFQDLLGSAYIFTLNDNNWTQKAKLTASDGNENDLFGLSVSLSSDGTTALIGAKEDDDNGDSSGSAYLFNSTSWSDCNETAKITAIDGEQYDWFGNALCLSSDGTTVVIGSPSNNGNGNYSGAVYSYLIGKE